MVTGDILHDDCADIGRAARLMRTLCDISPVYFVTGNHDVRRPNHTKIFQKEFGGAVFLDNSSTFWERDGAKIALCGIADPFSKLPARISQNVEESFSQMYAALSEFDGYKIMLFHRANLFDEIKDYPVDLILSGHMHGGQIRLPHLGGVLAPLSSALSHKRMVFPQYTAGRIDSGGKTMIINRGLTNTLPIPRLGNPCEIGIITLACAD